jgi:hypothetical protein
MSEGRDCEWCAGGDEPLMLDADGVEVGHSGKPGRLSHTWHDGFWRCRFAARSDAGQPWHRRALARISTLMDAAPADRSREAREMRALAIQVDAYERRVFG